MLLWRPEIGVHEKRYHRTKVGTLGIVGASQEYLFYTYAAVQSKQHYLLCVRVLTKQFQRLLIGQG